MLRDRHSKNHPSFTFCALVASFVVLWEGKETGNRRIETEEEEGWW